MEFGSLKVNVLGSAGSYQSPTRQCSSYLVTSGEIRIVLDAGNGSFGNLLKVQDPFGISAVFISHRHHDHMVDLISLYHFLKFVPNVTTARSKVPLFASKDTHEFISHFATGSIFDIFERRVVEAGDIVEIGGVKALFGAVNHVPGSLSISLTNQEGESLFYSGDTSYSDELADAIPDQSIILTEATYLVHKSEVGSAIHMDGGDVARLCRRSRAAGVIITHVAYPNDPQAVGELVVKNFSGTVEVANDLDVYEIKSGKLRRLAPSER